MPLNPPPLTQDFTLDRWLHLLLQQVNQTTSNNSSSFIVKQFYGGTYGC
jgi:hypothetical protein